MVSFSEIDSECIRFLSQPKILKGIFMIRAIRNKLKKDVDLVFHCENFNQYYVTFDFKHAGRGNDEEVHPHRIPVELRRLVMRASRLPAISKLSTSPSSGPASGPGRDVLFGPRVERAVGLRCCGVEFVPNICCTLRERPPAPVQIASIEAIRFGQPLKEQCVASKYGCYHDLTRC